MSLQNCYHLWVNSTPQEIYDSFDQIGFIYPENIICKTDYFLPYDYNKTIYWIFQLCLNVTLAPCRPKFPVPILFDKYKSFYNESTGQLTAIAFVSSKEIYVVFCATLTKEQWLDNFDFRQVPPIMLNNYEPGILIHQGFLNQYLSIRKPLQEFIQKYPRHQLVFAGHSLGAATSTVAALDYLDRYPIVYSYASPRVLNPQGAQKVSQTRFIRVYNTEDIVPYFDLPIIDRDGKKMLWEHVPEKLIGFTKNLGDLHKNHTEAYLEYLK